MSGRVYAKIITDTELEYAPSTYRGISNYNKCEEFMIEDGYLPVVEDSTGSVKKPFKYKTSTKKIVIEIKTFDGKVKKVKTLYIYKEYEEATLEELKTAKKAYFSALKIEKLEIGSPIIYKGNTYHIQLDADGKANILGIKIKIQEYQNQEEHIIYFKTYENIILPLTISEFNRLADAAFNYSEYAVFEKEKLLREIDNCATKEDLELVIWTEPEASDITDPNN